MAYTKKQIESIFTKICQRISEGEALRNIINKDDTFSSTVFYETIKDKEKNKQYARVCEERAEKIFEEILEIADKQGEDVVKTEDGEYINYNIINRNRLQIDSRKWILSKMMPKKYGDKVEIDSKSSDGSMSPKPNIIVNSDKTAKEINKLLDNG